MNGRVTQALEAARGPDPKAREQLLALVQSEIREMAHRQLARESPGHGLQTTLLVDDAFMKLFGTTGGPGSAEISFENRRHFFGAAAESIRRILIDHARAMSAEKRGGRMRGVAGAGGVGIDLDSLPKPETAVHDWEALGDALARLEATDLRAAEVVRLRFFAGLSEALVAQMLGVTDRTVRRDWVFAKAWLAAELNGGVDGRVRSEAGGKKEGD